MYKYGMRLRGFSIGCQPMDGFVKKYEDFDTVLVEEKDLLNYYRFCGLKEADEGEGNE